MKIDWNKAKADYVANPQETAVSIAKKYGISISQTEKVIARDKWFSLRKKTEENAEQKLPEKIGETIADINARHIRIGKILQSKGMAKVIDPDVQPRNIDDARKLTETGVIIERRAAGLDKPITKVVVGIKFATPEFREELEY